MSAAPLPEGITAVRVPEEAEVLEIARAMPPGLLLVSDGTRTVIAPFVPPGWHRLSVSVKGPA